MTEQNISIPKNHIRLATAAYIIFFIPLLSKSKDDPFVKFHTRQGIGLFVIVLALQTILPFIMINFLSIYFLFITAIQIIVITLAIIGIKNAHNGTTKPLPYIGEYIDNFFKK